MKDSETMMEEEKVMNEGNMAPNFELVSLKGEKIVLSELQGEKVYVKFWASWCSICLAGMDELNTLATESDFKVYTIVSPGKNGEQEKEAFIQWFNSLGYEGIEVLLDESGQVQKDYGIRAFPTSAYVGSDGVLVKVAPGHASNDLIRSSFETIK